MTQDEKYFSASRGFLAQAREELDRGELAQASEKGWGAAAQMVKSVAERRGWEHNGHASLFQVIRRLTDDTGDTQLVRLFQIANSLHINFYENWLPSQSVGDSIEAVAELVEKLETFLEQHS